MIADDRQYKIAISSMAFTEKIPQSSSTWKQFNGSFCNRELTDIEIANEIYMGHPLTTWHAHNWRKGDNYLCGQHIGIDFDTDDYRSSIDYLSGSELIKQYAAIAYTTPSHSAENPRARILFLLDTPIMQSKNYVLAAQALLWVFETADEKCKDPCRFFYGSTGCDIEFYGKTMPLGFLRNLIGEYRATGQAARQQREQTVKQNEFKPTTTSQEEVLAALRSIDPWGIDYDQWVKVLMSIHSAFPGSDGLSMANQWGKGKGNEIERKWKSFNNDGNAAGKVSINTMFKMARDNGYQGIRAS